MLYNFVEADTKGSTITFEGGRDATYQYHFKKTHNRPTLSV